MEFGRAAELGDEIKELNKILLEMWWFNYSSF